MIESYSTTSFHSSLIPTLQKFEPGLMCCPWCTLGEGKIVNHGYHQTLHDTTCISYWIETLCGYCMDGCVEKVVILPSHEMELMAVMIVLQPRFVVNRVTAGDYDCPKRVLGFLTDLHASFRMLNLRNDFLRKKFDGEFICHLLL